MERAEVYLNSSGELRIDSFFEKNNEYIDYRVEGKRAEQYIEELSSQSIRYAKEEGENLVVTYTGLKLIINEFQDILSKKKYKELFAPILLKIKRQEERKKVKELKNKKVQRKNKHIKSKIIATGLTLLTISTVSMGIVKSLEQSSILRDYKSSQVYTQEVEPDFEYQEKFIEDEKSVTSEDVAPQTEQINVQNKPIEPEQKVKLASLSYEDRSESSKAIKTNSDYGNIIQKYSKMYGLDSNLLIALATQERGVHSPNQDKGGATGIMQIQNSVWNNQNLKAYNFNTNSWESIIVDEKSLSNLDYNIKVGCMIFQDCLKSMNYNPLLAIQTYNMGRGSLNKVLNNYCIDTNKKKENVINDCYDTGWLSYRNLIQMGDQQYIENVLSYYGDNIKIENIKPDGNKIGINIINKKTEKIY